MSLEALKRNQDAMEIASLRSEVMRKTGLSRSGIQGAIYRVAQAAAKATAGR
jgi:hypothetical protein